MHKNAYHALYTGAPPRTQPPRARFVLVGGGGRKVSEERGDRKDQTIFHEIIRSNDKYHSISVTEKGVGNQQKQPTAIQIMVSRGFTLKTTARVAIGSAGRVTGVALQANCDDTYSNSSSSSNQAGSTHITSLHSSPRRVLCSLSVSLVDGSVLTGLE